MFPQDNWLQLNATDYIKKCNEYLNFFIKQGYNSFKLKMLAKTRDKLLPYNKKKDKTKRQ